MLRVRSTFRFIPQFLYQIVPEYQQGLHDYMHRLRQARKRPRFRDITQEHLQFFRALLDDSATRDHSLAQKRRLLMDRFPALQAFQELLQAHHKLET